MICLVVFFFFAAYEVANSAPNGGLACRPIQGLVLISFFVSFFFCRDLCVSNRIMPRCEAHSCKYDSFSRVLVFFRVCLIFLVLLGREVATY